MRLSLKLVDTNSQVRAKILDAMISHLQPAFNKTQQAIRLSLPAKIKTALMAEPEYNSLISDQLKYELGVPDADSKLSQIFDSWVANILIDAVPITATNNGLKGGFSISMIKSDFSDILSLSAATITDSISGSVVPWLQWLLLEGSKILIKDYKVQLGSNTRSRTGNAIMVSSDKENWRVPPQFAGTINNNWITRAIDRLDKTIEDDIQKELEKNI